MKAQTVGLLLMGLLMMGCAKDGTDGKNGVNGTNGASGPTGLPGPVSTVPFNYDGMMSFPTEQVRQIVPGLNLENGSVMNVYISWQGQPWTQIGSTWVGGMAGSYAVTGNVVTITVVIGPLAPQWQWAISGINKS